MKLYVYMYAYKNQNKMGLYLLTYENVHYVLNRKKKELSNGYLLILFQDKGNKPHLYTDLSMAICVCLRKNKGVERYAIRSSGADFRMGWANRIWLLGWVIVDFLTFELLQKSIIFAI